MEPIPEPNIPTFVQETIEFKKLPTLGEISGNKKTKKRQKNARMPSPCKATRKYPTSPTNWKNV